MRGNYNMQRLFLDAPLLAGARLEMDKAQSNYVFNVLRMADGASLLVFNGRDGEWCAHIERTGKKTAVLVCDHLERQQTPPCELIFCFAPLKAGRLDYMVQKGVEMGAGVLQPVLTDFTQNHRMSTDKMRAWTIEAAEQCGVLSLPECRAPVRFSELMDRWETERTLIFCDEAHAEHNPLPILNLINCRKIGALIGPEGGFSDAERHRLQTCAFVRSIPLGPRVLRADTAAVAALAVIQSTLGDWS